MPTLEDAIALAVDAHRGQIDKNGQPYILHPLAVMFRCGSESSRIVAVLHDVVEDTKYTFDDLKKLGYSAEILSALERVTNREGEDYAAFVDRAAGNSISREVKLADLEENMDVRRLSAFTEKDMQRTEKYLKAWRRLKEGV